MSRQFVSSHRFSVYQLSIGVRGYRPTIWRRVQVKDCLVGELHEIIFAAFGFKGDQSFRFCRVLPNAMHQAMAVRSCQPAAATTDSPAAGTLPAVVQRARTFWFRRRSIFEGPRMEHR
jgi:hypothetical protein